MRGVCSPSPSSTASKTLVARVIEIYHFRTIDRRHPRRPNQCAGFADLVAAQAHPAPSSGTVRTDRASGRESLWSVNRRLLIPSLRGPGSPTRSIAEAGDADGVGAGKAGREGTGSECWTNSRVSWFSGCLLERSVVVGQMRVGADQVVVASVLQRRVPCPSDVRKSNGD